MHRDRCRCKSKWKSTEQFSTPCQPQSRWTCQPSTTLAVWSAIASAGRGTTESKASFQLHLDALTPTLRPPSSPFWGAWPLSRSWPRSGSPRLPGALKGMLWNSNVFQLHLAEQVCIPSTLFSHWTSTQASLSPNDCPLQVLEPSAVS